jgi:hypothetical protein
MQLARCGVIMVLVLLALSPAAAEVAGQNDSEVRTVADPILEMVLTGFNQGDYALYSKFFDDMLKDAITEKKFRQVREDILKKLGKYQSRSYLGFLNKGRTTAVLWRARFSGGDDDVLIKLVLSKRGDKVRVSGLWFQ